MSVGKQANLMDFSSATPRTDFVQILVFSEHSGGGGGGKAVKLTFILQEHIFFPSFLLGLAELYVTIFKTPLMN